MKYLKKVDCIAADMHKNITSPYDDIFYRSPITIVVYVQAENISDGLHGLQNTFTLYLEIIIFEILKLQ